MTNKINAMRMVKTTMGTNTDWVQEKAKSTNVLEFNADNTGKALGSVINNNNEGIGSITNRNFSQNQLLLDPEKAREAINSLSFLQTVNNGIGKYEPFKRFREVVDGQDITRVRITQDDVDEMIQKIKVSNLEDDENVKNIFIDLNIVYRMYQEKTIDAAKKAIEVTIKIALKKHRALFLVPYDYKFDEEEKALKIKRSQYKASNMVDLFVDALSECQDSCASYLSDLYDSVAKNTPLISEEEIMRFMREPKNLTVSSDVRKIIKPIYNAMARDLSEARERAEFFKSSNQDEYDRLNHEASLLFKERVETLSILAKTILADLNPEEIANVLQYVSYTDSKLKVKKDSKSKMAFAVMQEELLTMVLNNYAEVKKAGYKVIVAKEDMIPGEFVFFENGASDEGSLIDFGKEEEYSTGLFEIIEQNSSLYAVQDIEFNDNKGDDIAISVINAEKEAIRRGDIVTVDQNGNVILDGNTAEDGYVVGSVQSGTPNYLQKVTNKSGKIKDIVFIKNGYTNVCLIKLTDVEDLAVEDATIAEIAYGSNEEDIAIIEGLEEQSNENNDGIASIEGLEENKETDISNEEQNDEEVPDIEDFDF